MKKSVLIFGLSFMMLLPLAAGKQTYSIALLPLSSVDKIDINEKFYASLYKHLKDNNTITIPVQEKLAEFASSARNNALFKKIAAKTNADYILYGTISKKNIRYPYKEDPLVYYNISLTLISTRNFSTIHQSQEHLLDNTAIDMVADKFINRLTAVLYTPPPRLTVRALPLNNNTISLTWFYDKRISSYSVYRSYFKNGPFLKIADTTKTSHQDKNVKPGVVYWYIIEGLVDNNWWQKSHIYTSFITVPRSRGLSFDHIIRMKTKDKPTFSHIEQNRIEELFQKTTSNYAYGSLKFGFIMKMAKYYMDKGEFIALDGFSEYKMMRGRRILYLIKPHSYYVKFYSKKLFHLYSDCPDLYPLKTITFGTQGDSAPYVKSGWGEEHPRHLWTNGNKSILSIPFNNPDSDLVLTLNLQDYFSPEKKIPFQRLTLFVNDNKLITWFVRDDHNYRVIIPKEYIKNNVLEIRFELPDANSFANFKINESNHMYGIALKTLTISKKPDVKDLFERLMDNAIIYCFYIDQRRVVLNNGITMQLPYYEALGLSTELYKNYKDWRSNTLLFATSSRQLIKKAERIKSKY